MLAPADLAELWEKDHAEAEKALDEFVVEHPDWWIVGGLVATFMDVGALYVDLLRFGEGLAEGTVDGVVRDLFRGASVATGLRAGPGALAKVLPRLKFYSGVGGNTCAIIATANALRRTGQKVFFNLDDVAKAHGFRSLDDVINGATIQETIVAFRRLGVTIKELGNAASLQNIIARTMGTSGVTMFRVTSPIGGHRVTAQNINGAFKIIDRYKVFSSLDELSRHYRTTFSVDPTAPLLLIPQSSWMLVQGLFTLMLEVVPVVNVSPQVTPETVVREFRAFKQRRYAGTGPVAGEKTIEVVSGTTLSGLAKTEYGSFELWPLIWDLNRQVVGTNPNRLTPGTKVRLRSLAAYTPDQIDDAKRRAGTWRNYPL
jgi:hypothetical protein